MSRILAMIKAGRERGIDDATLLAIIEAGEAAAPRSTGAERQARYRERNAKRNESDVTRDVTDKKEIPPIPPKEKNYTHTREATEAECFAKQIRDTFTMARAACPDLNPSIAWRKAGWPIEIVCETIRAKLEAAGTRRISTLNFFTGAIADAVAAANAPVPIGRAANQRAGPNGGTKATPERALREALGIGEFANVSGNDFQSPKPASPVIEGVGYRVADRA